MYCQTPIPPTLTTTSVFEKSVQYTAILYVPKGCREEYKAANIWSDFFDIREMDFSGIEDNLAEDVTIITQNGEIVVNGINEPVTIEVYSTSGQLLYRGSDTAIPVNERGIYLVRVGNYVEKVVL